MNAHNLNDFQRMTIEFALFYVAFCSKLRCGASPHFSLSPGELENLAARRLIFFWNGEFDGENPCCR